ncbi:hypothetical protein COW46_05025 [Candidatus Gracilibacteria bacterium CG17_big_fil_post_rev_8_21_14_2_50_48_13]|nr:MAG: hypothetical protein COW46_05025 [Candidatus Gracilibacteria bacterium CG17_big_fil_post_rev_8_21_14_2_50_48_13]
MAHTNTLEKTHALKDIDAALLTNMVEYSDQSRDGIQLLVNQFRAFIEENNLRDEVIALSWDAFTNGMEKEMSTALKNVVFGHSTQGEYEKYLK